MFNAIIQHIITTLCKNDHEVYIVGGAVRDIFLGKTPKDFDLATSALSNEIISLFPDKNIDTVGKTFQVVIVEGIEVATYRYDIYDEEGGLITVPARNILEDLSRRDLTINALAMCPFSGDIIDLFEGRKDIKNKIIRFVGNADDRINRDPCRILRACRIKAKISGDFEYDSQKSLENNIRLINIIAKERIRLEILLAMKNKNASIFFDALATLNGLRFIFPTFDRCFNLDGGRWHKETVSNHCLMAGDFISTKFPLLKLTGYLHDIGKAVVAAKDEEGNITFHGHEKEGLVVLEKELRDLTFSNDEIRYILNLISFHMRSLYNISSKALRKLISQLQEKNVNWRDYLRLKIADRRANLAKNPFTFSEIKGMVQLLTREIKEPTNCFNLKDLVVKGSDVMHILEINPCKMVGDVLKCLLEMVIETPELNEREKLIEIIEEMK